MAPGTGTSRPAALEIATERPIQFQNLKKPRASMRYEAPKSIDEAVKLLGGEKGNARILAGGTDLLVQMKSGRLEPDLVVDIKRIDGMRKISSEKGVFRIGAAVSGAEVNEHAELMKAWPGVAEAANLIGSTQVRGRASLVGNLCNASPAADSVPALVAANAMAVIAGPKGRREVPVADIPTAPGKTSLAKDEIVEAILLPAKLANTGDAYLRFIPRTEMDIAVVGVGVCLTIDGDGTCRQCARRARRRRPARHPVGGLRQGTDRHEGRRRGPFEARRRRIRGRHTNRRQARHQGVPHRCNRRAREARGQDCARAREGEVMSQIHVSTTVNGDAYEFLCEADEPLLDALRDRLGLTGAKEGCGTGDCGACTVTLDGRLVCSCLVLAAEAEGQKIGTIEGMADGEKLHPLQQKFLEHAALQCGICTPGFLVAAKNLLERNANPTETEVRYWLAGNLCRCTGYDKIIRAVMDTAKEMRRA